MGEILRSASITIERCNILQPLDDRAHLMIGSMPRLGIWESQVVPIPYLPLSSESATLRPSSSTAHDASARMTPICTALAGLGYALGMAKEGTIE